MIDWITHDIFQRRGRLLVGRERPVSRPHSAKHNPAGGRVGCTWGVSWKKGLSGSRDRHNGRGRGGGGVAPKKVERVPWLVATATPADEKQTQRTHGRTHRHTDAQLLQAHTCGQVHWYADHPRASEGLVCPSPNQTRPKALPIATGHRHRHTHAVLCAIVEYSSQCAVRSE